MSDASPQDLTGPEEVWYVSYGSNMSRRRFACYLEGGCPPGSTKQHPGARDQRPPRRSVGVELPGTVYFAGRSPQWGGGVAFYDHTTAGPAFGRAYLVTVGQLADIVAQEMHRVPAPGDPVEEVLLAGLDGGRHHAGPGHYETLVEVGRVDGTPMLTVTAPHGVHHVPHTAPTEAYLALLAEGLREAHGWSEQRCAGYLRRLGRTGMVPR